MIEIGLCVNDNRMFIELSSLIESIEMRDRDIVRKRKDALISLIVDQTSILKNKRKTKTKKRKKTTEWMMDVTLF